MAENSPKCPSPTRLSRLLIVANRLPVSITLKPSTNSSNSNEITLTPSAGGLVSALQGCGGDFGSNSLTESYWIGWPGCEISDSSDREKIEFRLMQNHKCLPVYLPAAMAHSFYNGFCNDLLWPLFHYLPLPMESVQSHESLFESYHQANKLFADVIISIYQEADIVWIHDYHLMLLPSLLRARVPDMKIGFFFHTPFPSSEIYRMMPSRRELLEGVIKSDLIGFHTHDYSRHFQSACTRIIGAAIAYSSVRFNSWDTALGAFPIGIDPGRFVEALKSASVQSIIGDLLVQFRNRKVLLGIDRLDYIKGIGHKLLAYEKFLTDHPEWIGKVVLVQIAVPSRTEVLEYQRLRSNIHELVGRLNGKFGTVDSVPIVYLDQTVPFDRMCGLYRIADAMLITSVRDGMNLVAYEYIACQQNRAGVLILSEFAGASQSLGAGAIQINPWNIAEIAASIYTALKRPLNDRKSGIRYCFQHVMTFTASAWAKSFVKGLMSSAAHTNQQEEMGNSSYDSESIPLIMDEVCKSFKLANRRLIITGLAGILASARAKEAASNKTTESSSNISSFAPADSIWEKFNNSSIGWTRSISLPEFEENAGELWGSASIVNDVVQDQTADSRSAEASSTPEMDELIEEDITNNAFLSDEGVQELKNAIRLLANHADTTYLIITCRSRQWCDTILEDTGCWMIAENGFFVKRPSGGNNWQRLLPEIDLTWKEEVRRVFEYFCQRTPHSYVQEQETHISWHYAASEQIFAQRQALDIITHLTGGPLTNTSAELVEEAGLVQVRPAAVSKGRALKAALSILLNDDTLMGTSEFHSSNRVLQNNQHSFIDFVLCIGTFINRDEDMFGFLNEWQRTGHLPPLTLGAEVNFQPSLQSEQSLGQSQISQTPFRANELGPESSLFSQLNDLPISIATTPLNSSPGPRRRMVSNCLNIEPPSSANTQDDIKVVPPISIYTVCIGQVSSRAMYKLGSIMESNAVIKQLSATL